MIFLYEQFGYKDTGHLSEEQIALCKDISLDKPIIKKMRGCNTPCFSLHYDSDKRQHRFETSYFVGVDWIVENKRSIYVQPKQNKTGAQIDFMAMLFEALIEPENFKHLDGLCEIDFDRPHIKITQAQDILSPLLIVQYLQLLRRIVQKGLKKSYYIVYGNLNARIKGKVLIGKDIKTNKLHGNSVRTMCQFQEFGINCDENRILKKAFMFARKAMQCYENGIDTKYLRHIADYIGPAFTRISEDIDTTKIKSFKPNPLFKEYEVALKLAMLILRRYSYNISLTEQQQISTPPFWIDMSKLFELYVYKKLREIFHKDQIIYHQRVVQNQEPDFLINGDESCKYVVDAKYKPRYENHILSVPDIRQISGYARVKSVYKELGIVNLDQNIKCLIIYSRRDGFELLTEKSFIPKQDNGDDSGLLIEEQGYVNFFKVGIRLPEI